MVPELKRLKAMYVYEILSEKGEELSRADINKILWDLFLLYFLCGQKFSHAKSIIKLTQN